MTTRRQRSSGQPNLLPVEAGGLALSTLLPFLDFCGVPDSQRASVLMKESEPSLLTQPMTLIPESPQPSRCGSDCKEPALNARDPGSTPGLGRSPWRREWLPTPDGPGTVHRVAKKRTRLSVSLHIKGLRVCTSRPIHPSKTVDYSTERTFRIEFGVTHTQDLDKVISAVKGITSLSIISFSSRYNVFLFFCYVFICKNLSYKFCSPII